MATPPGNGLRTVNSVMMEMALHLVEPCVITSILAPVTGVGTETVAVTSTVGMYVGALIVVSNADGASPLTIAISAFNPVALTVTAAFLQAYPAGSLLLGGTFPTQQPSDPLFTQSEILGYIARAQNEFLSKLPGVFDFFANIPLTTGQVFYPAPATAIEMERVAVQSSGGGANIVSVSRASGLATAILDADSSLIANTTIVIAGVPDPAFNGIFTVLTVSADGLTVTWQQFDSSPDASSAGGTLSWSIYSRLYEVTQNELAMRDPQWFYNTTNPFPTSWYEDRTGVYGWGVAGVPQSNLIVELLCSVRDSEVLALTDHFVAPDLFVHAIKWKAMQWVFEKNGEERSPSMARVCSQRFDRILMAADRYLRNFIEATQGAQ